jgi:glyoxalase family protein
MPHPIRHLHHVTATVDEAWPDLEFTQRRLGLRLVKRTVNFDNHFVHHFYYGTELGAPGTIWTTFPYAGWNVPAGVSGTGQVVATAFSVPAGTLDRWRARLEATGSPVTDAADRPDERALTLRDPSGLVLELVEDSRDTRPAWAGGGVDPGMAIRGLHDVTLRLRQRGPTIELMTELLGFEVVAESAGRTRLAVGGNAPGHLVDLVEDPAMPPGRNGLGTVHHVAFAIEGEDEQLRLRQALVARGLEVTPVRDRTYFRSIYFREPGGVLFEVATMAPGFAVDEPLEQLGQALRLPPWEEPHRSEIAARLPAVSAPS